MSRMIHAFAAYYKKRNTKLEGRNMLMIYANSFRTATRSGTIQTRDVPQATPRKRWLPKGHWFVQSSHSIRSDRT